MTNDLPYKIDQIIKEAEELKSKHYQTPEYTLWERRTKIFINDNYGKDFTEIFNQTIDWPSIMTTGQGQRMHTDALQRAIIFLEKLKTEKSLIKEKSSKPKINHINRLHPSIKEKCSSLFKKEEYPEAVEKGFKIVRDRLRELTTYETGSDAFGKTKIHIKGATATNVDKDFNEAVKFLTMAIDKFRNEKSHTSDGNITDPNKAYEYLALSSLAMRLLDNAEILP